MPGFFRIGGYAQTVAADVAQYPQTFGMAFGGGCFGMMQGKFVVSFQMLALQVDVGKCGMGIGVIFLCGLLKPVNGFIRSRR